MRISAVLASIWLCIIATNVCAHGRTDFKGSEGGIVRVIVASPSKPNFIYAATSQSGIFKSSDGGKYWLPINHGLTRVDVLSLVLDPENTATLYAGTRNGLFKTIDGGATWKNTGDALGSEQIKVLMLDPNHSRHVFAGTYHGLWKSIDAGETWSRLANQPENANISALIIAKDTSHSIYAGTPDGLFRSRDEGTTWTRSSNGLTVPAIAKLALDPIRPQILYAGTGDGAYKSEDGGDTWQSITFGQINLPVSALLVDPRHSDTLYLGTSFVGGFFKTEDAGKTWVRIQGEAFTPAITALAFSPIDPNGLIAGTSFYSKVFTSPDAGMTWNAIPGELALPVLENITGTVDGEFLFAAAKDGLYQFSKALQKWKHVDNAGIGRLSKVAIEKGQSPRLWICGSRGIAEGKSKNGDLEFRYQDLAPNDCKHLILDKQNGLVIAATDTDLWIGPGRWKKRAVPVQGEPIQHLMLSKNGRDIYVLTDHHLLHSVYEGKNWKAVEKKGSFVFTSVAETSSSQTETWIATSSDVSQLKTDGKWLNVSQGIFPPGVSAITASQNNAMKYAASLILGRVFTLKANDSVWSSSDIEEGIPDISDLWTDPVQDGLVYVATRNSGLFRSVDYGKHWLAVNAGLEKMHNKDHMLLKK